MLSPIKTVLIHYPLRAFVTITLLLIVSVVAFGILKEKYKNKKITKQNSIVMWLLINYSILLLYFTVLGRRALDYYRYNFDFGYSYQEVFLLGDCTLASQIFVNILMFIPVGILCGIIIEKHMLIKTLLYGLALSFIIEILQLVLRRGYCEFDDLLSNALGTLVGCIVVKIYYCLKRMNKYMLEDGMKKKLFYIVRYPIYENFNLKGKFDGQLKSFQNLDMDVYYLVFDQEFFYLVHNEDKKKICRTHFSFPMYFHTRLYYDMHCAVLKVLDMVQFDYVYWRAAPVWYSSYKVAKKLHQKGIKILYEIPTYDKIGEKPMGTLRKIFAMYSKIWEKKLISYLDLYVLIFTQDAKVKTLHNKPVAIIDNGVDVESIPLRNPIDKGEEVHILALASMSYWHGYDRLIKSLHQYTGDRKVVLHMVGGNDGGMLPVWQKLAEDLHMGDKVIFHGKMYGEELSNMFDLCDVGANALAQYTKNLNETSELKVREYTARGLPFLCSVEDPALNYTDEPFWLRVANDDSLLDRQQSVDFAVKMRSDKNHPARMRKYAETYMTWESQYAPIFDKLNK